MRRVSRSVLGVSLALAGALTFAGCAASETPVEPAVQAQTTPAVEDASTFLARHDLGGLDAVQVIDTLEATAVADRPDNLIASVQPANLVLTDDTGKQSTLPIPDDKFYVSIAPYASKTHDCYFHSLTTCRGEMANAAVTITVTTDAGEKIIDGEFTTQDNGFVGLWLPRDMSGSITIEADGKSVTAPIATGSEDPTCVTTLQLT